MTTAALILLLLASPLTCAQVIAQKAGSENQSPNQQTESEKLFLEDVRIIHRWDGEKADGEFGWVARVIGDIDGDDVLDFVTSAPSLNSGNGKIYVYSGKSGTLIFAVDGEHRERLGNGAAGAGDVDGDRVPDVIAGAPAGGSAYVYSGKTGEEIHKFSSADKGDRFGYKVCSLGDVDDDGHSDVFVTATSASGDHKQSGAGYAYSGKTGDLLFQLEGQRAGDKFGSAAAAIMQSDSGMLAVGAQDAGPNQCGKVYVYRIKNANAKLAFEIEGDANSVNLGQMFVSFPGDVDQDGVLDVYASDFSDNTAAHGAGKVAIHSGRDGKRLLTLTGSQTREGFGTSPSEAGDVNGDGVGDLVIGAWQHSGGARSGGRVTLHDGADGQLLDTWTCTVPGETFGFDAVGIGDVDGDGHIDFLLTGGWSRVRGPKTGRVFLIAGKAYARPNRD